MKSCLVFSIGLIVLSASALSAATINWGVEFSQGTFSDGSTVPSGFTFEIGTFASAFEPSAANTSQWRTNFLTSGLGGGNSLTWTNQENPLFPTIGEGLGSSTLRLGGDLQEGDQVYLWGYNSLVNAPDSEWILLTNAAWLLPAGTAAGEVPSTTVDFYPTNPGTQRVFGGAFNLAGNDQYFDRGWQTAAIPEPSAYALLIAFAAAGMIGIRRLNRTAKAGGRLPDRG